MMRGFGLGPVGGFLVALFALAELIAGPFWHGRRRRRAVRR